MTEEVHLLLLALTWIGYAAIHSLLATHTCKSLFQKFFPHAFRGYRLGFNLLSGALLIPPLWLVFSYPGNPLWHWPAALRLVVDTAALAAVAGFAWSLKMYDSAEFLGLSQLGRTPPGILDQAPMRLSWAHRFVRHPWYFFGLVIIWTREMNAAFLVTALALTLYLVIGSRLEERKLIACYGEQYRAYRKRVPGLFPVPWRYLTLQQAKEILSIKSRNAELD